VLPLLLAFALPVLGEDPRLPALIAQGDEQDRESRPRDALRTLHQAEQIDPENVGILLRLAKLYSDLVDSTKGPVSEQMARRSLEYSQHALKLDGQNAKAHLSVAVAYGKLTNFVGNRQKVDYSKVVREEVDKSLAIDPTDPFGWHVLGRWHAGVANVGPVLKALAKVAYGGLPPASNEEAVKSFQKAIELSPERLVHHAELARVYQIIGRQDLAQKEWRAILAHPGTSPEDEREKKAAQAALAAVASSKGEQ
jgi:tetratricopeptide (TPR) repeat protein